MVTIEEEFQKVCNKHKISVKFGNQIMISTFKAMAGIMKRLEFAIIRLPYIGRFETTYEWIEKYKEGKMLSELKKQNETYN